MSPSPNNPFRRKFWNLFNNVLTGLWELGLSFLGSLRYVCLEFLVVMKAQEKAEVILGFHCWRAAEPLTGGFVIGCPWELPKCLVLWNACFSYTHMNQKTFCLEKSNTGGLKKKKSLVSRQLWSNHYALRVSDSWQTASKAFKETCHWCILRSQKILSICKQW